MHGRSADLEQLCRFPQAEQFLLIDTFHSKRSKNVPLCDPGTPHHICCNLKNRPPDDLARNPAVFQQRRVLSFDVPQQFEVVHAATDACL